jgi:hypothetical protein
VRRTASDLLVAVALLHGADHLAGTYAVQDQRAPGGVIAVVSGKLPLRKSGQNRQLRKTRLEADTRKLPPRVYSTTFTSRPGTTMTLRGSVPSTRAAIRSSASAASRTWSWFADAGTVTRDRSLPLT